MYIRTLYAKHAFELMFSSKQRLEHNTQMGNSPCFGNTRNDLVRAWMYTRRSDTFLIPNNKYKMLTLPNDSQKYIGGYNRRRSKPRKSSQGRKRTKIRTLFLEKARLRALRDNALYALRPILIPAIVLHEASWARLPPACLHVRTSLLTHACIFIKILLNPTSP